MYENDTDIGFMRPHLREGLQLLAPSGDRGGLVYHEATGRYFKLSGQTYDLFALLDGQRPLVAVTSLYNAQQHTSLTIEEVYEVLKIKFQQLVNLDASLETSNEMPGLQKKTPSYLKLSTVILNASLVEKVANQFTFLFSKKIAGIFITLFVFTIGAIVLKYADILDWKVLSGYTRHWEWYVLLIMLSSLWHELGHAAACRYYQVRHGGIGVGFYLFTPVMFADVTAAWLLPPRQRIVINLGGIYFELVFSVVLSAVSLITNSFFLASTCLFILIKLAYNLNPFFRTDGYWVLSDALQIHNLRQKSNAALQKLLFSVIKPGPMSLQISEWALAMYSLVSWFFIASFLWYVLFVFEGSLIYFPYYLYELVFDVFGNEHIALVSFFTQLNKVIIPLFFYYLVFRLLFNYLPIKKKS